MTAFALVARFASSLDASEETSTNGIARLRPKSELSTDCFGFPQENFHRNNCIKCTHGTSPAIPVSVGDAAIDFTLHDLAGIPHTLSHMLQEKPVVLIWGMYTCPAYQGMGTTYPFDECSYNDEWDVVDAYNSSVAFVHLVGPEPHPSQPDTNFDSGKMLMNYWSTVRQRRTWEGRLESARSIEGTTHPAALLLPDYMTGTPYSKLNHPVWCSLGLGARTAMLIGKDGTVEYTSDWFRKSDLVDAIEEHLSRGVHREAEDANDASISDVSAASTASR